VSAHDLARASEREGPVVIPERLPDWVLSEIAAWPQDAFGVQHTRLLLRDGTVLAPVAVLPSGDIVGWGSAGATDFDPADIVAIERIDE